jgi:hypothetical protein
MYKIQLYITDDDPMSPTGLPLYPNATLKCKILKLNLTIDRWPEGETKMLDFSYCLAKQYTRQYYTLEIINSDEKLDERFRFDNITGKLTLIKEGFRTKSPKLMQIKVGLRDPNYP